MVSVRLLVFLLRAHPYAQNLLLALCSEIVHESAQG